MSSTRLRIFKWIKGLGSKETSAASVGEYSRLFSVKNWVENVN